MIKPIRCALLLLIVCASCTKSNETSVTPLNETVAGNDTTAVKKVMGAFVNGTYGTVSGTVSIYLQSGKYTLALENVAISNGPDLHVYLSKEIQPVNFIDLGKLKSVAGNQVYDVANMPDFAAYKYALIHCQQYNHLFGSAELK
ncbi:MAG: DM13 domain-containing protein [Bacteroidota bacterium]